MEHLREIRKARGLTMKQLGQMVGVTESAIGQYETDKRNPSYEMILKLSKALDCSVDYLLTGRSGLIARSTNEPFVDETESFDEIGNSAGQVYNYNTLFAGNEEHDAELAALLEDLRSRPDMRMLFKLAHDATPEDVRQAVKIIEALRRE